MLEQELAFHHELTLLTDLIEARSHENRALASSALALGEAVKTSEEAAKTRACLNATGFMAEARVHGAIARAKWKLWKQKDIEEAKSE